MSERHDKDFMPYCAAELRKVTLTVVAYSHGAGVAGDPVRRVYELHDDERGCIARQDSFIGKSWASLGGAFGGDE